MPRTSTDNPSFLCAFSRTFLYSGLRLSTRLTFLTRSLRSTYYMMHALRVVQSLAIWTPDNTLRFARSVDLLWQSTELLIEHRRHENRLHFQSCIFSCRSHKVRLGSNYWDILHRCIVVDASYRLRNVSSNAIWKFGKYSAFRTKPYPR